MKQKPPVTIRFGIWGRGTGNLLFGRRRAAEHNSEADRARLVSKTLGYGVIGNTAVSGTAILGSSPGTPAEIRSILWPDSDKLSLLSIQEQG